MNKKIFLATDHAGFELKEKIKTILSDEGYEVKDFGAYEYNGQDDYPDFISKAAAAISDNPQAMAIIFGGSGQGEAIVANRFKYVRAAVLNCENIDLVRLAREHNDANILSIGARFVGEQFAMEAVKTFLGTEFKGVERHKRRLNKINSL